MEDASCGYPVWTSLEPRDLRLSPESLVHCAPWLWVYWSSLTNYDWVNPRWGLYCSREKRKGLLKKEAGKQGYNAKPGSASDAWTPA